MIPLVLQVVISPDRVVLNRCKRAKKLGLGRPRYPYEEYMHGCCTGVDALAEDVRESLDNVLNIVVDGEREGSSRDNSQ